MTCVRPWCALARAITQSRLLTKKLVLGFVLFVTYEHVVRQTPMRMWEYDRSWVVVVKPNGEVGLQDY